MRRLLAIAIIMTLSLLGCRREAEAPFHDFTLHDAQGNAWSLKQHPGEFIVLNFYATWCNECPAELAVIAAFDRDYNTKSVVILRDPHNKEQAAKALAVAGLDAPILLDTEAQVYKLYDINNMPTTILLNKNGREVARAIDGLASEHDLMRKTIEHLNRPKKNW